jgi:ankyrin repeat protein
MTDEPVIDLKNDRLLALKRKRRGSSDLALLQDTQSKSRSELASTSTSTQTQTHGLRTPPATPHRSKKCVKLSGTSPSSSPTGLTPILSRNSLSSRSNLSPDDSTGLEQTLQFVRSQDIRDRGERAQRRRVLSEVTQEIQSKKRLKEEIACLKNTLNQLGAEGCIPTVDTSQNVAKSKDLEHAYDEENTLIPSVDDDFNVETTDTCHGTPQGSSSSPPDHNSAEKISANSTDGVLNGNMDTDNVLSQQDNLFDAAKFGRTAILRMLLERGDDPNQVRDGLTPLMLAVLGKHKATLQALLSREEVRTDIYGGPLRDTALTYAIKTGDEEVVRLLLGDDSIDPDIPNGNGDTALCCAIQLCHTVVIKLFLETHSVNVNARNARGETALWSPALSGHTAIVGLLLENNRVDVNTRDESGCTLLWWLASKGQSAIVQLLLQRNDIALNETTKGLTPLMVAARGGHEAVVKLLLERDDIRTDINDRGNDNLGWTALVYAVEGGVEAVVRRLVEKDNADVDNALQRAASNGNEAMVRLLLKHGVTKEGLDSALRTASNAILPHAGHEAVIRFLSGRLE